MSQEMEHAFPLIVVGIVGVIMVLVIGGLFLFM
jgi:hypothetical protein